MAAWRPSGTSKETYYPTEKRHLSETTHETTIYHSISSTATPFLLSQKYHMFELFTGY